LGLELTTVWDKLKIDTWAKLGVGINQERATVSGFTTFVDPIGGNEFVDPRLGTFAQPTNVGTYHRNVTAYFGDFGLNVTHEFTRNLRIKIGYDFSLIKNVIRPSDQIDYRVNPQPLLGPVILPPALPAPPTMSQQSIQVHMFNVGLEI